MGPTAGEGRERRKDPRAALRLPIRYRMVGASMNIWYPGTIENLSAGGVNLVADQILEGGDEVELEVTLPGRQNPYLLKGQVVSECSSSFGAFAYGLAFIDTGTGCRLELDNLVRFLTSKRASS